MKISFWGILVFNLVIPGGTAGMDFFSFLFMFHLRCVAIINDRILQCAWTVGGSKEQNARSNLEDCSPLFSFGNTVCFFLFLFFTLFSLPRSDFTLHEPANSRKSEWRSHLAETLGLPCSSPWKRLTSAASSGSAAAKILNRRPKKLCE